MTKEISADGSFKRQKALFSTPFGTDQEELPIEKNRYRLIWAAPCPWSHRAVIARRILGLENAISLGEVDPIRPDVPRVDWAFTLDKNQVDPVLEVKYLSELYTNSDSNYVGRPTVPAMVDITTKQVVNNDYFTLTNQLATMWSSFHKKDAPNLYPKHLRKQIDAINETIYTEVNNGVYKCGFARSQIAYEKAYDILFARLSELEQLLTKQRFLLGDYITDADIRLYVTLVRFDTAYYSAFKTNKQSLIDFPNLWDYARDLYMTQGFGDTTDFEAIKNHYYISASLTPGHKKHEIIVPKGPDLSGWTEKPHREHLSHHSDEKFLIMNIK